MTPPEDIELAESIRAIARWADPDRIPELSNLTVATMTAAPAPCGRVAAALVARRRRPWP